MRYAVLFVLFALAAPRALADDALYRDLGERPGIDRFIGRALELSLADQRIAKSFDNSNIARIRTLLTDQVCQLTGGPCEYKGRDMRKAHAHLRLSNVHFNALVENLQTAMDESEIPFRTQNELLALLAAMQPDVTAGTVSKFPEKPPEPSAR